MTIDLQRQPTPLTDETGPPAKEKLDLSLSKILGGALAAMTAAALGSRLSVAGTIVGAALASVIAAVAGSLYTASLKRTQDKVRTVWTGRTGSDLQPARIEQRVNWDEPRPARPRTASRVSWKGIVVAALATFGIAAVSLTGYELVSGHALSGGSGTTITQAAEPQSSSTPTPSASRSSATPTPTPTETASERPTTAPSTVPSSEPTASSTPSASSTPTPTAAPTPSMTAQAEPTP